MSLSLKGTETNGIVELSLQNNVHSDTIIITDSNDITTFKGQEIDVFDGFAADTTIKTLIIGSSVKELETGCFQNCTGLTGNLNIPNSVYTIASQAFQNCTGLTGNLNIPSSIKYLKNRAFDGCSGFNGTLTFETNSNPSAIVETYEISWNAFRGCSGFTGDLILPEGLELINAGCFVGCSGFDGTLTLPNSLKQIFYNAFLNCSGFTGDLTIPGGVITIQERVFEGCTNITNVNCYINKSIIDSGTNCFLNSGVTTIHARSTDSSWTAGSGQTIGGKTGITVIKDL
jgi:hypothetical protein